MQDILGWIKKDLRIGSVSSLSDFKDGSLFADIFRALNIDFPA